MRVDNFGLIMESPPFERPILAPFPGRSSKERQNVSTAGGKPVEHEFEPLFSSTQAALKFAFNFSTDQYDRPAMNKASDDEKKSGRGLSGLDGAAQAGMIKAEVDRLPPPQSWIVTAIYMPSEYPCSCKARCCKGTRENDEWREVIDRLQMWVLTAGLSGCVSYYHLRRDLVLRYINEQKHRPKGRSFLEIAARVQINRDTVSDHYQKIKAAMVSEQKRGWYDLCARLEEVGMVSK